jgi:transmembrane sensor
MERKYFKSLTDQERKQLKKEIFQRLNFPEQVEYNSVKHWKNAWIIGIAATILVVIGVLMLDKVDSQNSNKIFIASTREGELKKIMLPDSSIVILNSNSTLYSNTDYLSGTREIYLEGNGFFKVKKQLSKQRFVVHADSVLITVLGTEFNVNARSSLVEVALTHGRVELKRGENDKHPELMQPGEKLKLKQDRKSFERSTIDTYLYSAWTKGEWNFKNTSLSEIAGIVKEYYGVNIVFNNERTKELRITAVIPVTTLHGLVNVIEETLLINISENNKQLTIQ